MNHLLKLFNTFYNSNW